MTRDRTALTRYLATLVLLALLVALLRHYEPPNRDAAFPTSEIVIGVDGSFPPFALDDGGNLQGLDIELGQAIAAEIGLPARFVNIGFYGLYDSLISGEVHLLISALNVDRARMDDVRYTQPYFDNGLLLVSPSTAPLTHERDLAGARIAYEFASQADSHIRDWERNGLAIERLPYELPSYALDALRLGSADTALVDASALRLYANEWEAWKVEYQYLTHEPYAVAVRIDHIDAWKLVDGALSTLKDKGELARIVAKWF